MRHFESDGRPESRSEIGTGLFSVEVEHDLDIALTSHNYRAALMDIFWDQLEHAVESSFEHASGCDAAALLNNQGLDARSGGQDAELSGGTMGKPSYSTRSLPFLDLASAGYMKMPPYSSVRCTSATCNQSLVRLQLMQLKPWVIAVWWQHTIEPT